MHRIGQIVVVMICSFSIGYVINDSGMPATYSQGFQAGYKQGKVDAFAPRETNHELQEVCLSMWISNQIREQK
jgi:hypothetical protein